MAQIAVTTECEWSPAERFVSGSAPQKSGATRPSLDVQSVPCFKRSRKSQVARNTVYQEKKNTKQLLTILEVPLKGLERISRSDHEQHDTRNARRDGQQEVDDGSRARDVGDGGFHPLVNL